MDKTQFITAINPSYQCSGASMTLGAAKLEQVVVQDVIVNVALKMLNRHGLISGATGTGKTKTIQLMSELLSSAGVPVLLMDIKGDLSGLARPGQVSESISKRSKALNVEFAPKTFPVELLTISELPGVRLRATISELGPILFGKMLDLNDTQTGLLAMVFKYAQDQKLALIDCKDIRKLLTHVQDEGKAEIEANYGAISKASIGTILRKLIELEQQGADTFFGEPSFEVSDLMRKDEQNRAYINILQLSDMQSQPKLFSSFMLSLLAEIYQSFPEAGDLDKPKLVIFIDEAHLIFDQASDALLDQIEMIVKLIRSKGVGLIFCTQLPTDIPEKVLSQLGLKVQHALRAFTAKDRKAIKLTAQNYPESEFYETDKLLTQLGIGEALVTTLDEKGRVTPLVETYLRAPESRMGPLQLDEIMHLVNESKLVAKYQHSVDRESAYEILEQRIEKNNQEQKETKKSPKPFSTTSVLEKLSKNTMVRQMGNTVVKKLMTALLSALGLEKSRRSKRK